MLTATAGWTLSYELAPDHLLGQYQGIWQTFSDLATRAVGPALMTAMLTIPGGWFMMAGGFAVVSGATPTVIGRSVRASRQRHRQATGQ